MTSDRFDLTTELSASAEEVWGHATSLEGISFELAPWLRMGAPHGLDATAFSRKLREGALPPVVVGRAWVFLLGVVPCDWDDMVLIELDPGRRFLERSRMLSLRIWEHERIVQPVAGGSAVTDRLAWQVRSPVPRSIALSVVRSLFRHRHRRLSERFGA